MSNSKQSSIVAKSTQLMEIIARSPRPLGFSEIAERSGFVKSSTHRILSVLQHEGLVEHDDRIKAYRLGPRLLRLALDAWRGTDLQQNAALELDQLCADTGCNLALAIRDEDSALYLRTVNNIPVRYAVSVGDHAPLHCTAVGKVLVAFLPKARRRKLVEKLSFERFTEFSHTTADDFLAELDQVRDLGYAFSNREEFLQVCGVAAPVRDSQGDVIAAITVWAPVRIADIDSLTRYIPGLIEAANRISQRLGYH